MRGSFVESTCVAATQFVTCKNISFGIFMPIVYTASIYQHKYNTNMWNIIPDNGNNTD